MALTPAAFKARYPAFAETLDATIQAAIDDAVLEMNAAMWGSLYDRGAYALTAHLLTVSNGAGSAPIGGVVSRSVGDVSVTFAQRSTAMDDLGSTSYGCEYVRLRKLISGGALHV